LLDLLRRRGDCTRHRSHVSPLPCLASPGVCRYTPPLRAVSHLTMQISMVQEYLPLYLSRVLAVRLPGRCRSVAEKARRVLAFCGTRTAIRRRQRTSARATPRERARGVDTDKPNADGVACVVLLAYTNRSEARQIGPLGQRRTRRARLRQGGGDLSPLSSGLSPIRPLGGVPGSERHRSAPESPSSAPRDQTREGA
jgi:hypothetical protein